MRHETATLGQKEQIQRFHLSHIFASFLSFNNQDAETPIL